MRDLIWLIPLFPLAGFVVNGVLYLASHRTKGEAGHGAAHGENPAHTHAAGATHDAHGHAPVPFKSLHSVIGTGSVALSVLFAFGSDRRRSWTGQSVSR